MDAYDEYLSIISEFEPEHIRVYTDGSHSRTEERTGYGIRIIKCSRGREAVLLQESSGLGDASINDGELTAVHVALNWLLHKHKGPLVPIMEAAKTAAQSAALAVASKSPTPAQPLIPLSTSNAFVRCALKARQQRSWFPIVQAKRGLDHLSRLRPCVSAASAFFVGTRRQQTILARLRFGTCNLNFSKSRLHANVNEECECGMRETVRHFLLECPLFESARSELVANVRTIRTMRDKVITEDVLLGGSGVSLSPEHWEVIVSSVEKYVLSTKRKI